MRPARVSVSSLVGWMTRYSSSGSSVTSTRAGPAPCSNDIGAAAYIRPAATIRWRNWRVRSSRGDPKMALRRPLLEDAPLVEEADAVRDVAGEAHLVRRDQHRHPAGRELADHVEHLGDELGVEGARHLVEQEEPRLHRERPHDRDPLLLAAGEPVGVLVALVDEAEPLEQRRRPRRRGLVRERPRAFRGASVTLSSTVMCGKRLNAWKTIPIPRRTRLTSTPRAVISSPATTIRPASIGSSRLTQRRSVDLPGAGGADQADDLVLGERRGRCRAAPRACRTTCGCPRARARGVALTRASRPAAGAGRARRASR